MALSHHTNIATEGMLSHHTLIALMGFGWGIEIVVPPEYLGGGGGGIGGNWPTTGGRHTTQYKSKPNKPIPVTVRVTIQGKTTNRMFMVRPSKLRYVVKIANIMNAISSHISIEVANVKRGIDRIINVIFPDK